MSILLQDLVRWCDQTLAAASFKDYCPNGLQVEGKASHRAFGDGGDG
jgi:putative NIF3 family GTP cyclohydrolase 1 type 2